MSGSDPVVLFEQLYQQERAAVIESQKAALNAALTEWLLKIRGKIDDELRALGYPPRHHPRYLLLLQPLFKNLTSGAVMADIQLPLNQSYTAVITEFNPTTQSFDPVAATDVFTATPSDTVNMSATVAPFVPPANATASQTALAGIPAVTVEWLHTVSPLLVGISVVITDTAGSSPLTLEFDMLAPNVVPDQLGVDAADAVFATIATPT